MMRSVVSALMLAVGLASASTSHAQSPRSAPVRDHSAPQAQGNCGIAGVVTVAETGNPLRRAQVRLTRVGLPGESVRTTDAQGAFQFDGLQPGRYRLSANKAGFIPRYFNQAGLSDAGEAIDVEAGQTRGGVRMSLQRGGVIEGRMLDEHGEPLVDATVSAWRIEYVDGARQMRSGPRAARSNDIGEYRLFGLQPGEYFVVASVQAAQDGPMGRRAGPVGRNQSMRATVASMWSSPTPSSESQDLALTYFPGVVEPASAQSVKVEASRETAGIDFVVRDIRAAHVAGRVVDKTGKPVTRGSIALRATDNTAALTMTASITEGGFRFNAVAPGNYVLDMRQPVAPADGRQLAIEIGRLPVSVPTGQSVDDVSVVLSAGAAVQGRVVWDGGQTPGAPPLRVSAVSVLDEPRSMTSTAIVAEDGSFELRGVHQDIVFRAEGVPHGWFLKDVKIGGRAITDQPQSFRPDTVVSGMEIVLTNRLGRLEGTLARKPEGSVEQSVVVFSADSSKWTPRSRFVRLLHLDAEGRFTADGLPDGEYLVAVVPAGQEGNETSAESLKQNAGQGTRARVHEGETSKVIVRADR